MSRSFHAKPIAIQADAQGQPPKVIELLRVGKWETSWHGDFEITPEDITEFAANFSEGIGLVAADKKMPINYGHMAHDKAAAWVDKVYPSDDGQALLGEPDWTPAATEAIKAGEWKYISPEFNPRAFPWEDPEEEFKFVKNVITGAALTNIPLFKNLKPVMASRVTGSRDNNNEGDDMDLEEVRAKKLEELTEEEKTFLAEHKADLTDDERKAFGLEEAGGDPENDPKDDPENPEEEQGGEPKKASVNGGLTAEQIAQLQADAKAGREAQQELLKTRLTASVQSHIDRGAIKSDQLDAAVSLLMASSDSQRGKLEEFLKGLPENKLVSAGEKGHGGGVAASAQDELMERAHKVVADSKGKTQLGKAIQEVLRADSSLKERVEAERSE